MLRMKKKFYGLYYRLRTIESDQRTFVYEVNIAFGVACPMLQVFFGSKNDIIKNCCAFKQRQAPGVADIKTNIPCDDKGKGKIQNNQFYYRPCIPGQCKNSILLSANNSFKFGRQLGLPSQHSLYDVLQFFVPRYRRYLGSLTTPTEGKDTFSNVATGIDNS